MPRLLPHSFFNRPTLLVAEKLIGCLLVRARNGKVIRSVITEVEAYDGFEDRASHASYGLTARNAIMFRSAGHIYIYFTYGMHWMLNIVTGTVGYPAAILIRGVEGVNGPARLTKALKIDGSLNGKKLGKTTGLWIEEGTKKITRRHIGRGPRIGVGYAGPVWSKRRYRFFLKG